MRTNTILAGLGAVLALGAIVTAEQRGTATLVPPPQGGVRFSEPYRPPSATGNTRVIGTVIDIRQVPVARAKVQLRDLKTGSVIAEGDTDDLGRYTFDLADPGTYVVEMVMVDGYVVALSNAGSLARYETLQTVVQLPGRWDAVTRDVIATQQSSNFLGMSGAATMTASTLQLANDQNIGPVESGEPVSAITF